MATHTRPQFQRQSWRSPARRSRLKRRGRRLEEMEKGETVKKMEGVTCWLLNSLRVLLEAGAANLVQLRVEDGLLAISK